jgi:hypothetical protein
MRKNALGASPVGQRQFVFVLDQVAEGITDRPGAADQLANFVLSTQPFQAALVVAGQALVVPADRPADWAMMAVDAGGGMMGGRDAARDPVLEPAQVAQRVRHGPNARARLPFQLHDVELGNAAFGPQVGRQADFGQRVAFQIKRQALDAAGAEVPAGDDAAGRDALEILGHGCLAPGTFGSERETINRVP